MPNRRKPYDRRSRRLRLGGGAQSNSNRCGKIRYTTAAAAETAAQLKAETFDTYPDWLRAYYCPRCFGHHLTSQPKRSDPSP